MKLKLEELTEQSYIDCKNKLEREFILSELTRLKFKIDHINNDDAVIVRVIPKEMDASTFYVQIVEGDKYNASQFMPVSDTTTNQNDPQQHSMNC